MHAAGPRATPAGLLDVRHRTTHSDALGAGPRHRIAGVWRMSAAVLLTADASKTLPPHGPHRPPDPLACEYSVTGALLDGSAVINSANVSVSSDITDMTDDPQPSAAAVACRRAFEPADLVPGRLAPRDHPSS